jgi:hypothetical protein
VPNSNKRNNSVDSFVGNGTMSLDSTEIREHIMQFYNQFYSEQFSWVPKLDGLSFNSIGVEEASWLERAFKESEVLECKSP